LSTSLQQGAEPAVMLNLEVAFVFALAACVLLALGLMLQR
jgi:hypothetical protein